MNELPERGHEIPVLTEIIDSTAPAPARPGEATPASTSAPQDVAGELLAGAESLIEQTVRQAFTDLEGQMQEQIRARIRAQLPALIAQILHSHAGAKDISNP